MEREGERKGGQEDREEREGVKEQVGVKGGEGEGDRVRSYNCHKNQLAF